ncbi:Crp/Fnr family transcriptional regulator [Flavobacterium sp.]|uniref:Crp/Fnr family transcriptional regulator n=1 Tax=Flavobacterium sp. TaxID=239 RepID=UPI002B4B1E5B|nr:Crp/Fnr family transcriptional regulator [Flavobacterium sp.]HLP65421.1 Crp/Fnr family transcriptional regulator [Flavobacterium sp.]
MDLATQIKHQFPHFNSDLISEMLQFAIEKEVKKDTELLREGQFIKVIPLVFSGVIKVFTRHEDKELLLYYIKPNESCIMSFSAGINNQPSKIYAVTEEDSHLLLIPTEKLGQWTKKFPDFNSLFFLQYNLRYSDLLDTINSLLFDRLDKRVLDYLKEKVDVTQHNPLKISHRQIASELGTAREVISRIVKKLEMEGKVKQSPTTIEVLD